MFNLLKKDGEARLGIIKIGQREIETPNYVVVATDGQIRCLTQEDIPKTKTQIVISNTYHLSQSLGKEGLSQFPGLHEFMGWNGLIMTDSGGFQVFSMGKARTQNTGKVSNKEHRASQNLNQVRVTDDGVYFTNDIGEEIYLDAEISIKIQEQLGADIILAFDEPSSPKDDYEATKKSMRRTHDWATRSLAAKISDQKIYGIVQGGNFKDLRVESAKFINQLDFDGFAIGGAFGSSFGSEKHHTFEELEWVSPLLDEQKPRHLLGIGRIDDIFEAVERGVDTMDCVIPTREARHGGIWTSNGRIDITKGQYSSDNSALVKNCFCPTCQEEGTTKSKLYELFKSKDLEAGHLATIHNVYFFNDLMRQVREAIKNNSFKTLKKRFLSTA